MEYFEQMDEGQLVEYAIQMSLQDSRRYTQTSSDNNIYHHWKAMFTPECVLILSCSTLETASDENLKILSAIDEGSYLEPFI